MKQMRRRRSVSGNEAVGRIISTLVGPPSRETIQALEALSSRPRGPEDMSTENLEIIPKNGCSHYVLRAGKEIARFTSIEAEEAFVMS